MFADGAGGDGLSPILEVRVQAELAAGERLVWTGQARRLAPPARELFDMLVDAPGDRLGGEEIAKRLGLEKGAHGVAGILAWPGRYSRHLERVLPIATEGRADGGTDYYMDPDTAALFDAARAQADTASRPRRHGRAPR